MLVTLESNRTVIGMEKGKKISNDNLDRMGKEKDLNKEREGETSGRFKLW